MTDTRNQQMNTLKATMLRLSLLAFIATLLIAAWPKAAMRAQAAAPSLPIVNSKIASVAHRDGNDEIYIMKAELRATSVLRARAQSKRDKG